MRTPSPSTDIYVYISRSTKHSNAIHLRIHFDAIMYKNEMLLERIAVVRHNYNNRRTAEAGRPVNSGVVARKSATKPRFIVTIFGAKKFASETYLPN